MFSRVKLISCQSLGTPGRASLVGVSQGLNFNQFIHVDFYPSIAWYSVVVLVAFT